MRPTVHRPLLAALTLLVVLATPAAAKEFLQATLDAPIALDTPPGTEILVGVTVDGFWRCAGQASVAWGATTWACGSRSATPRENVVAWGATTASQLVCRVRQRRDPWHGAPRAGTSPPATPSGGENRGVRRHERGCDSRWNASPTGFVA